VLWADEFILIKTGMWRGEVLCMYLRQNEKACVVGHEMQIVFAHLGGPADEVIAGLDLPRGRAPSQAGHGPVTDESDVLEMIAHDLSVSEVMMPLNQKVVQRFLGCVPHRPESDRRQIFKAAPYRGFVHLDDGNEARPPVFPALSCRRVFDEAPAMQRDEHLPAGHVFEVPVGLAPVPLAAQDPGDLSAAPAPVVIDDFLDERHLTDVDGPFSDGQRQHDQRITEKGRRRQRKMDPTGKSRARGFGGTKICVSAGMKMDFWG